MNCDEGPPCSHPRTQQLSSSASTILAGRLAGKIDNANIKEKHKPFGLCFFTDCRKSPLRGFSTKSCSLLRAEFVRQRRTNSTLAAYYNKFGQKAGQPVRLSSVSCLSYNKRDNWLTNAALGFYARFSDCQPSSYCSVRFKQVEPQSSCHQIV